MATEEEVGDEEVPESPEATVPSHDPFSFKLFSIIQGQQSRNGLRHNDHLRYRQYCSRRIRRLKCTLKVQNGRRYKAMQWPADFNDVRFLEIPLAQAERAWSYGVQLKADNAAAASMNPRMRYHGIMRFARAARWAQFLESVCKVHADQRAQMEAEAYTAFMEGVWKIEREEWSEALEKVTRCKKVCEYLGLASDAEAGNFLKDKAAELVPLIRQCKYNLGMDFDADDDGGAQATKKATESPKDLSGLSYRGQGLACPSDRIKGKIVMCLQAVKDLQGIDVTDASKDNTQVVDKYGNLSADFADLLGNIHTDMIAQAAQGQVDQWRMLEAFARELSLSMNVERNMVLLWNHLMKLEQLEDIVSPESRKICRPDEGMRYCDLLKEDIQNLKDLPETTDEISETLSAYLQVVMNCRAFFLALCNVALGKTLEAAALMDMLHGRVQDVAIGGPLQDPLGRFQPLFERVQENLPAMVSKWRCRGLAQLCIAAAMKGKAAPAVATAGANTGKAAESNQEMTSFPPKFRDIPCKPLLFDLAFPCIAEPDIDAILEPAGGEGQQKGFLGRVAGVAGGLGSRFGGLFGGGKK